MNANVNATTTADTAKTTADKSWERLQMMLEIGDSKGQDRALAAYREAVKQISKFNN